MRIISTSIHIQAPAAFVWQILLDFKLYAEWNPFIQSLSGDARPGGTLYVDLHPPGARAMKFAPICLAVETDHLLRWKGKLGVNGIFDGEHSFELTSPRDHETLFKQYEVFTGLLVPFVWKSMVKSTNNGFDSMNEALKIRAEKLFAEMH